MDSLDAQCLLISLAEPEGVIPDLWHHDRSGALSFAFEGSDRSFTWQAQSVADMARRWRDSDAPVPEQARMFLDAHQRLEAVAEEASLGPADVVIHDLGRAELRGIWRDRKVMVVIDEIGEPLVRSVTGSA